MDRNKVNKKLYCMIPARIGSTRLKYKNLALIKDKAVIEYTILNAKKSKLFDKIYINSDSEIFSYFAKKHKVNFFHRSKKYGSSNAKSDDVIFNFIDKNNINDGILIWLNPIAPLLNSEIIKEVIFKFFDLNLSSAITSNSRQVHASFGERNVNFKKNTKFSKTQDLNPISTLNYAIMMWDIKKFIQNYKKNGYCFFINRYKNIDIPENNSFIIKNIYDLRIVENFMHFQKNKKTTVKYHKELFKNKI